MTYIPQKHIENLKKLITPGKVVVIYGARRVGKTTLLQKFLENEDASKVLFVNGDDIMVRHYLESQSINKLQDFVGEHVLLVVDEAQHIERIGLNLKIIVDHSQVENSFYPCFHWLKWKSQGRKSDTKPRLI